MDSADVSQKIQRLLDSATTLAECEIERLARHVLRNNRRRVLNFTMSTGDFFFCDLENEIIHTFEGDNEELLQNMNGYNELVSFIDTWDEQLSITGSPMHFSADGEKITDW